MEIRALLEEAIRDQAFPGAQWATRRGDGATGRLSYEAGSPAVTPETLYDLASLSKVLWTTVGTMILIQEGKLSIDTPVQDFFPMRFPGVTIEHLLRHTSGLPAHRKFWEYPVDMPEAVLNEPLTFRPGGRTEYSCVGFLLLAMVLNKVESAESLWPRVRQWWGTEELYHVALEELPVGREVAPTETVPVHPIPNAQPGEIHDENARHWPGAAGNAGVFGTARAIAACAETWIHRAKRERLVQSFQTPLDGFRPLGWDRKAATGSSAGTLFGPSTFGHTGFTGVSLWIDPEDGTYGVLVTNRVHPTRENEKIHRVRPAFYDAVKREE